MPTRRPGARRRLVGRFLLRHLARTVLRLYFRWRVTNVPQLDGGFVIVANHSSFLDPLVAGAAAPRSVRFLINGVNYRSRALGWFYRVFEAIPVSLRGGNREALRAARDGLDDGEIVGIFPEGGISRDGGLLLGNPGAVALVLSKNAPVVPMGLVGVDRALPYTGGFPLPTKIEVRFGDPIPPAELMVGDNRKERLANATERLMVEIGKLCDLEPREVVLRRERVEKTTS